MYLEAGLDAGPDGQTTPQTTGHIVELSFDGMPPMAINADVTATLVRTIDASAWITPSPDPAGIAYLEPFGTLLISDSEVDEMPMYFTGDNVFEMTRDGSLLRTSTTISFSPEPTGVAHDPANGYLFFSDDDREQIHQVDLGPNGKYDSTDDRTSFDTEGFGCTDPEGVAFDSWNGDIFLADGLNSEVYRVDPGGDGEFGTGDDVITHWDTSGFLSDPEGITFDPENGFLYLIGTTSDVMIHVKLDATDILTVVRTIDISAANSRSPAGLTVAPGSQDPGVMHLYMTDRGIDNGFDPWENDGKIYELYVPALEPDVAIAKSVEPAFVSAGDIITYTLTFSNAGGYAATGVVITDIIPAELTVQSVISSGVEITDTGAVQPYVWQVQDLTTADRGVITITAELTSTLSCFDTFTNTATIGTTSVDTRPGNNSSAVTRAAEAGVSVAPLSDSKSANPGQNIVYTLRVTNTGHCSDTFDRSYSGGAWPVSSVPVVGPLDPDAGAPVNVTVSVPACTLGGVSDGVTVIYTSQHHGTTVDSAALTTSADFVAPVAGDDQYSVLEDESLSVAAPGVLEDDSDANCESLSASVNTPPAHGTVVLDPDGSFTYTPTLNFHGVDTFTYDASDGALSGTGTVTITVTSADDDPDVDAGPDQEDIPEGQEVSFSGGFVDPARQVLSSEESILWDFGDGKTATGALTPTHTYYDNDLYTVTLTVTDTEGDVGQDSLTVTVLNVAPTVDAGPDQKAEPSDLLSFTGSFTDPGDDDTHTFQWDIDGTPIANTLTFDHAFGTAGNYTVTLTVTDDDGGVGTDSAHVSVRLKVYLPLLFKINRP